MIGGNAQLVLGAAHAVGFTPGDLRTADLHAAYHAALLHKGNDHARPHIGCAADHAIHLVSGIYRKQVKLLGIRVILHRQDLSRNYVPQVFSHVKYFLHLGGGKGKTMDQRFQIQAGKIYKIPDPIH